jgi:outer membrane protein assembly factor BamB
VLWRTNPADIAKTKDLLYFTTPAVIGDVNGDGVPDLVVVYGGDALKLPGTPRPPSYLAAISGKDGKVLAAHVSPDSAEMYSSVVVYDRPGRGQWMVFGTGGETASGAAYRAPVSSLLNGTFQDSVQRLCEPGPKGVIAPATLVDLNGDGELDIVISTFDGRLIAVDGKTGKQLWEEHDPGEETYHPAAVLRGVGGGLGLLVSRGIGTFPKYTGSVHRLIDAKTGKVLYKYQDDLNPAGAPLAVDLNDDGVDEGIFFSTAFPKAQGSRIYVLDIAGQKLLAHNLNSIFWSTPVIADPRKTGTLEMIGLSWTQTPSEGQASWKDLHWHLLRLNLNAKTPPFRSWAGYMGTHWNGIWEGPAK